MVSDSKATAFIVGTALAVGVFLFVAWDLAHHYVLPLILLIVLLASDPEVMGAQVNSPFQQILGWLTFAVMAAAAVALLLA